MQPNPDALRIFDPAEPKREYPQEFYIARGLAKLLSDIGRPVDAAEALRVALEAKRAA